MKITPAGAPTSFRGPFDAFNAPVPLPPRPDEALPYYGDLQAQRVQTVPVPDAPAPSSGFGLLGGLGGLLGGGQATPSMVQPASSTGGGGLFGTGFLDFSDPKTLMAMQLIANGSKAPGQMMDGIAETAAYGQKLKMAQEEKAKEQQQQNRTIAWLQKNRPDLVPLAEAGYVGEAFKMAMQKPETNAYDERAAVAQRYGIDPNTAEGQKFILTGDLPAEAKPTEYQMREAELARQGIDPASPEGRAFILSGKYAGSGTGEDGEFKPEQDLRKEYRATPEYKRYDEIRASYERIRSSAQRESGAADLGVIFSYMKMLDPGSVVREGEFANAQNSSGVPDQVRNMYNRVVSGERLTPEQRAEFVNVANDLYANEVGRIEELNRSYGDVAGQYGLEPSRVIVQPKTFEPLKVGQAREVDVGGVPVTIRKKGQ